MNQAYLKPDRLFCRPDANGVCGRALLVLCLLLAPFMQPAIAGEHFHVSLSRTETGTYSMPDVLIEGQVTTEFLVDTGASYASLSRQTFRRLKGEEKPQVVRHIHGALADGSVVKVPVYRLRSLRLAEGCEVNDVEVVVMGDSGRDIIGMNILSLLQPLTMSLNPPALEGSCSSLVAGESA